MSSSHVPVYQVHDTCTRYMILGCCCWAPVFLSRVAKKSTAAAAAAVYLHVHAAALTQLQKKHDPSIVGTQALTRSLQNSFPQLLASVVRHVCLSLLPAGASPPNDSSSTYAFHVLLAHRRSARVLLLCAAYEYSSYSCSCCVVRMSET